MLTNSELVLTFILNAAWQLPVIVTVAGIASRLLRNGPARYRHLIWVIALLAGVVVPISSATGRRVTTSLPSQIPAIAEAVIPQTTSFVPAQGGARLTSSPRAVSFSTGASSVVIALYAAAVMFALLRLLLVVTNTVLIRTGAERRLPSPQMAATWSACLEAYGLSNADLLSSARVQSPVALGILRPAVVIPDQLWHEPSNELLTAALGHELAHIVRRDFAVNFFCELLLLPIAFHPAAWLIRRNMQRTREMACDEAVTTLLLNPHIYAKSIVQIATSLSQPSSPALALGIFEGGDLEERIRRVLRRSMVDSKKARLFAVAAVTTLVVSAAAVAGLALNARGQTPGDAQIKEGIAAYNAGDFHTATARFTSAVTTDPANIPAKLYLANSLLSEFHGQQTDPDERLRTAAMQQYTDALAREPNNKQALAGMTSLTMETRKIGEAREWAEKLGAIDSSDKSVWYARGVLEWMTLDLYRKRPGGKASTDNGSLRPGRFGSSRKKEAAGAAR